MPQNKTKRGTGSVALVGAGPGDPELLTLKAVRMLQSADVVLFDALVSDGVLELVRREARCLAVGKRGGRASCRQQDINDLMVRFARRGKRVVRLKAGDPTIFGRAGEEIARLEAAGIPVEIVPGITAGLAAAAALGVSLTHRDQAHSVRFVTGHSKDGGLPEGLDWRGLADAETSLVFYMAGRTGAAAARRLISERLSPATPAVMMAAVSRPDEERWAGTLAGLAADGSPFGTDKPVLLGIGRVFAKATRAVDKELIRGCAGQARA
jgi:uroporphyrin-III C-methyltransferase/precorrin-2 dehydrogenase/sirohydrochlorin ferrochelatase